MSWIKPRLVPLLLATLTGVAGLELCRGSAVAQTFDAVETWSVALTYRDWSGFTGTRLFNGREISRITIRDGTYTLANKVGHHLLEQDPAQTKRQIVQSGEGYSIHGGHVFAPAFVARTHAIVFLGAFIVSVPLIDGDVPTFHDSEAYAASGELGAIVGGGSMTGYFLTASVQSTLSLTEVTIPPPGADGPFGAVAGNYAGVFVEPTAVLAESSGFISAKVSALGKFSARLTSFAGKIGFSGQLDASGRFGRNVRLGTNTLAVEFELNPAGGPLTGLITAERWTSGFSAERAAFNAKTRPADGLANRYTLKIQGSLLPEQPKGDGVAAVQISVGGQVAVKGTLADGTPLAHTGALAEAGRWPVYQKLPGGRGFILGWLEASDQNESAINGVVHWSKLVGTETGAPLSWAGFTTTVEGSVWHPFDAASLVADRTIELGFSYGDLPSPLYRAVTFSEQGKIVPGVERLQFKLSPFTGLFTGTFEPAGLGAKLRFKGAILPRLGYGTGYFLGANASGLLQLQ